MKAHTTITVGDPRSSATYEVPKDKDFIRKADGTVKINKPRQRNMTAVQPKKANITAKEFDKLQKDVKEIKETVNQMNAYMIQLINMGYSPAIINNFNNIALVDGRNNFSLRNVRT
jgi:hypothetical protein